jgi:hypothetical protein
LSAVRALEIGVFDERHRSVGLAEHRAALRTSASISSTSATATSEDASPDLALPEARPMTRGACDCADHDGGDDQDRSLAAVPAAPLLSTHGGCVLSGPTSEAASAFESENQQDRSSGVFGTATQSAP